MTIKTDVKAGGIPYSGWNHNEGLAVRSDVKAGAGWYGAPNHNEGLAIRSDVKAGGKSLNHSETLAA